jgi:hypothetical protein
MFIRIKKYAKTGNFYIQIVENTRVDGTTRQRVIKHIGTARNDEEIKALKKVAETIKNEIIASRSISNKANELKYGRQFKSLKNVHSNAKTTIATLKEANRQILGIHDVYNYIYDSLNFSSSFANPSRRKHSSRILREIVLARIAKPCSKRSSVEMLEQEFGKKINLDHVYQMMDKIDDTFCDRIQERALKGTLKLTGEKIKVLFYDATTLYFESFTEDELKQNGYSKDMKFNQPQLLLALFVTRDGLPVGYEVFPGATYEGHTLKPVLNKLKNRYHIEEMIFVADRGMLSKNNLEYLEKNNIPYIVCIFLPHLDSNSCHTWTPIPVLTGQ